MDVPMESGEDEIAALREQLRQVQGRAEHLRRIGHEQSRSLAVSVPELEAAVELSLKVASAFGGLEIKRNKIIEYREGVQKRSDSVHTFSGGDLREPAAGPRYAGHGTSFSGLSNGSVEQRGILGAPYKANVDVDMGGPRLPGDSWGGGDGSVGEGWGADSWGGGGWDGGRGAGPMNALGVVKAMVAGCLLSHTTALPIDSMNIHHRMLAKEVNPIEMDALHEVGGGGEAGGITAVDYALRAMTEAGGLQIEEIEDYRYGGLHVLVLNFDRGRLMKELPGGCLPPPPRMGGEHHHRGVMEPNGGPHGLPTRADMWDHHQGGPPPGGPMFPGGGGPPLMVPRNGPRGMGMVGMPGGGPGLGGGFGGPFPRPPHGPVLHGGMGGKGRGLSEEEDIDALLHKKSFKEQQQSKTAEELLELLHRPTAKETANAAKFKTKGGSALKEYCAALTKEDCRHQRNHFIACEKMHFRRIIAPHTDSNLGDCSFLDTCRHMKTCKYVHYELDPIPDVPDLMMAPGIPLNPRPGSRPQRAEYCSDAELGEPQWVQCDIRNFKMDVLGQFGVIMADPPWDIHMELPYGTMADDEMRNLNVPALQTDGLIFLWVTGRAMELGRECLELWGYKRVEEIIWVKTNQLQRIIRTGRTGHWLNHSKEHCLVGIKGHPDVNRNIDTDVIVAEVRETSRKPDEVVLMLPFVLGLAILLQYLNIERPKFHTVCSCSFFRITNFLRS
ncbi:hypothetical protein M758_2G067100 [Ceratodon purpureus]|nr:hypothetical protein M758_2G067100 [Ceratodon purpureus]